MAGLGLNLRGLSLHRVLVALDHGGLGDRVLDLGLLRVLRLLTRLRRLLLAARQGGRRAQGRQRPAIGHGRVVLNVDVHRQLGITTHGLGNLAGLGLQKRLGLLGAVPVGLSVGLKVRDVADVLRLLVGADQFVVQGALVLAGLRIGLDRLHDVVTDHLGGLRRLLGCILALSLSRKGGQYGIGLTAGKGRLDQGCVLALVLGLRLGAGLIAVARVATRAGILRARLAVRALNLVIAVGIAVAVDRILAAAVGIAAVVVCLAVAVGGADVRLVVAAVVAVTAAGVVALADLVVIAELALALLIA